MSTILIAIVAVVILAGLFGAVLGFASIKFKVEADPIVDQIDSILPQTQCGQCGYPGCRPYAEAIANGDAINKCPPGGQPTIEKLADLMGVEVEDSAHDAEKSIKKVAFIHEDMCIGCTKFINEFGLESFLV
jgi:electron transport complex protein RnfB